MFKSTIEAIETTGGSPGLNLVAYRVVVIKYDLDYNTAETEKKNVILEEAVHGFLAALFFTGLSNKFFSHLRTMSIMIG